MATTRRRDARNQARAQGPIPSGLETAWLKSPSTRARDREYELLRRPPCIRSQSARACKRQLVRSLLSSPDRSDAPPDSGVGVIEMGAITIDAVGDIMLLEGDAASGRCVGTASGECDLERLSKPTTRRSRDRCSELGEGTAGF